MTSTPTTVSDIMETFGRFAHGGTIPTGVAQAITEALRVVPGFGEKSWVNSFCHGRYTSPAAKWTAEDGTGRVQISWSVNAATGADNGYRISQDSHWDAYTLRESLRLQKQHSDSAKNYQERADQYRRQGEGHREQALRYTLKAHRRILSAATARRQGDMQHASWYLGLAAQDRGTAEYFFALGKKDLGYASNMSQQAAKERAASTAASPDGLEIWEREPTRA